MYSLLQRLYAILCHAAGILVGCAILSTLTAPIFFDTKSTVSANSTITVHSITKEYEYRDQVDYARVSLDVDANLSSLFHWGTKHIFFWISAEYTTKTNTRNEIVIWDKILSSKSEADFHYKNERAEYPLVDFGTELHGKNITLIPGWMVISITGLLPKYHGTPTTFKIPNYSQNTA